MATLYEHWRPDVNECFYVGISWANEETRPYNTSARNVHYNRIINKLRSNGLEPEIKIQASNLTKDEALQLEIYQISYWRDLIGKRLTNITDGGDNPPINRMFGNKNPMTRKEISKKQTLTMSVIRADENYRKRCAEARKGKGTGDRNAMRKDENKFIFCGLNNSMSKYEFREKHYSQNKTKGKNNGMYGKNGDQNPMYGKVSAMRGKKNLGIAWAAKNKTWQPYWGA